MTKVVAVETAPKYKMTISRLTVDKLGVKLYDRVSAVLAELVANSYDADATEVVIKAPMGLYLATKKKENPEESGTVDEKFILEDRGYILEIEDNGIGMTPVEVNEFYLKVGAERRNDPRRGDTSKIFNRKVMGRKGVGKLAPFGICQKVEIITSGGGMVTGKDENGKTAQGYLTAHIILNQRKILTESDVDYHPEVGSLDGIVRATKGTTLKLSEFSYRQVPDIDLLAREMAQRFGISSQNWEIKLIDSAKPGNVSNERVVGKFDVVTMPETKVTFDGVNAFTQDGEVHTSIKAGFECNGKFYPITGWIAYAQANYKDDLVAGIRIYCRGKITAQTSIFNLKSGFTGEYDVRSYIVGEINADWLDETDDLIQTDRRDILWSHEIGEAFEQWGQEVVKIIGKRARNPMKQKVWDIFQEKSNIQERIKNAFPADDQDAIRVRALDFATRIGKTMREGEVNDPEQVEAIVELSLTFAPHITLSDQLQKAADESTSPLAAITGILKTAHVAELSSYGKIADERLRVIQRIEELKDDANTLESVFQKLIETAPWLIDPQWSPISANQSFSTLRVEFQKYYKTKTDTDLVLSAISDPTKRPDFVLSNQESVIQIIEIKRPVHKLQNEEVNRINTYKDVMTEFLNDPANSEIVKMFHGFHITLVCDGLDLTGVHQTAFDGMKDSGILSHINWASFLAKTKKMHEEFLAEADRQKKLASAPGTPSTIPS